MRKEEEAKRESRKSLDFFLPLASVSLISWPFQGLLRATEVISFFFLPLLFSASLGVKVLMSWNKLKGRRRGLREVGGFCDPHRGASVTDSQTQIPSSEDHLQYPIYS